MSRSLAVKHTIILCASEIVLRAVRCFNSLNNCALVAKIIAEPAQTQSAVEDDEQEDYEENIATVEQTLDDYLHLHAGEQLVTACPKLPATGTHHRLSSVGQCSP